MKIANLLQKEKVILFLLFLLALGLRLWGLGERPLHHDESLHALYSKYLYFPSNSPFYEYHPMLHGPLLYYLTAPLLWTLGEAHSIIRLLPAVLGSFLALGPYLWRRYLGSFLGITLSVYLCFSPLSLYWSRFLRHDPLFLTVLFSLFLVTTTWKDKCKWAIIPFLSIALFTIKENAYIYLVFTLTFLAVMGAFRSFPRHLLTKVSLYKKHIFLGTTVGVCLYALLYSQFFTEPGGILDGLYRKSLVYWWEQHGKERLSGPFSYPFFMLFWYAPVWIFGLTLHLFTFYKRRPFLLFLPLFVFLPLPFINDQLLAIEALKLKIPMDSYLFFFLLTHGALVTFIYLWEKKNLLALLGFALFAQFFTYSFVGEKVPWLVLYPFMTGVFYFALEFRREFSSITDKSQCYLIPIFTLAIILSLRISLPLNFEQLKAKELIHQVHTTPEYERLGLKLREKLQQRDFFVYNKEENGWPMSWYLYGNRNYHYHGPRKPLEEYDVLLTSFKGKELQKKLPSSFRRRDLPLRQWWQPRYTSMNLGDILMYTLFRKPWNETGEKKVTVFTKDALTGR